MTMLYAVRPCIQVAAQQVHLFGIAVVQEQVRGITKTTTVKDMAQLLVAVVVSDTFKPVH